MKIQDLKKLVSQVGSVILMDDSGTGLVVLSYEQYQSLLGIEAVETESSGHLAVPETSDREEVERLNREISLLKEEIKQRELQELAEETVVDEH